MDIIKNEEFSWRRKIAWTLGGTVLFIGLSVARKLPLIVGLPATGAFSVALLYFFARRHGLRLSWRSYAVASLLGAELAANQLLHWTVGSALFVGLFVALGLPRRTAQVPLDER